MDHIVLQDKPLELTAIVSLVQAPSCGAIDVFIGTARDHTRGKSVLYLDFEAYEPMAIRELRAIADRARQQWPVHKLAIYHRTGKVEIGEAAVIIAVSTPHREAAFAACKFVIDTLKETVPIWKKEVFEDGSVWVAAHP